MSTFIIRVQKSDNFTVISNTMLRDSRLSFGARGLLAYLLSRPNDWVVNIEDLISQSDAGRDAVYRMLKELETCKYLKRERKPGEGGRFRWEITVYELPYDSSLLSEPSTGLPDTAKPEMVPITEKPANQPSTDLPDTAEPSTASPDTAKPHVTKERINEETNEASQRVGAPAEESDAVIAERLLAYYGEHVKPVSHLNSQVRTAWLTRLALRVREGWSEADLQKMFDGCALDDWKDRWKWNKVTDILKDRDSMLHFLNLAEEMPKRGGRDGPGRAPTGRKSNVEKSIDALHSFIAKEQGHVR